MLAIGQRCSIGMAQVNRPNLVQLPPKTTNSLSTGSTVPRRPQCQTKWNRGSIIAPTSPSGEIHEHLFYFLDDNGDGENTTLPEAGIYLLGMRLDIPGLEQSDSFYMVWATPEISVLPAIQPAAAWVNARVDTLYVEAIAGDFDTDNDVDGADFLTWQRQRLTLGDAEALAQWNVNYGEGLATPVGVSHVPEPSSLGCLVCLLAFFQLFFLRR